MPAFRFIADLHLHEWPQFSRTGPDGWNTRLRSQADCLKRLLDLPLGGEENIPQDQSVLVVAGDVAHVRGALSPFVIEAMLEVFGHACARFQMVVALEGNHDYPRRVTDLRASSFGILREAAKTLPNLKIASGAPSLHEFPGGQGLYAVPWRETPEQFREALDSLIAVRPPEDFNIGSILAAHQMFAGSKLPSGVTAPDGVTPETLRAARFDLVVLGDVHLPQVLAKHPDGSPHILYCGAPMEHDRGDAGKGPRGAVDAVPGPSGFVISRPETPGAPRFLSFASEAEARKAAAQGHYVDFQGLQEAADRLGEEFPGRVVQRAENAPQEARERASGVSVYSTPAEVLDAWAATVEDGDKVLEGFTREEIVSEAGALLAVAQPKARADFRHEMRIRIERVRAENFLSYRSLDVSLDRLGAVLVDGLNLTPAGGTSNEAGKSSIVEAVFYALFGETLRDCPAAGVVMRGQRGGYAMVEMSREDGSAMRVVSNRAHPAHPDGLSVWQDGRNITPASPAEGRALVCAFLGCSKTAARRTLLFGQCSDFNFPGATDREQKDYLESLVDLSAFEAPRDAAAKMASALTEEISKVSSAKMRAEGALEQKRRGMDSLRALAESFEEDRKRALAELKEKELPLMDSALSLCGMLSIKGAALEKVPGLVDSKVDGLMKKLEEHEAKADEAQRKAGAEQAKREAALKDKARWERVGRAESCPECGGKIDAGAAADRAASAADEYERASRDAALFCKERDRMRAVCDSVRQEISSLEETRREAERISLRMEEIAAARKELKAEKNSAGSELAALRTAVKEQEEEIAAKTAELAEMEESRKLALVLSRLFGPQGLPAVLFSALMPSITERVREALDTLSDGALTYSLEMEQRGRSEKILQKIGNAFGGEGFGPQSGGAKQKISLAVAWAVAGLYDRFNLFVVDEGFDSLDALGQERAAQLVERCGRETVLVMTHRSAVAAGFSKVWHVVKTSKGSVLCTKGEEFDEAVRVDAQGKPFRAGGLPGTGEAVPRDEVRPGAEARRRGGDKRRQAARAS